MRVDDIATPSASASAVTVCWSPPRVGDVAKYELNVVASAAPDDVERRQIWIDATDSERRDGRRRCRQLDTRHLRPGRLHYVHLRPWTARRRPGLSVVALFNVSGS